MKQALLSLVFSFSSLISLSMSANISNDILGPVCVGASVNDIEDKITLFLQENQGGKVVKKTTFKLLSLKQKSSHYSPIMTHTKYYFYDAHGEKDIIQTSMWDSGIQRTCRDSLPSMSKGTIIKFLNKHHGDKVSHGSSKCKVVMSRTYKLDDSSPQDDGQLLLTSTQFDFFDTNGEKIIKPHVKEVK